MTLSPPNVERLGHQRAASRDDLEEAIVEVEPMSFMFGSITQICPTSDARPCGPPRRPLPRDNFLALRVYERCKTGSARWR